MLVCLFVFVIVRYDKIKEVFELVVRVMATSVDTNARVSVFASREYRLLE